MHFKPGFIFLLLAWAVVGTLQAAGPIAQGYWVKVKVNAEGVYRVSYQDLANAGFDVNNLDPRNIKLLGHQGGMLTERNGTHIPGLPEIPVFIAGESDGSFNTSDYILFYGGGITKWVFNTATSQFEHRLNLYSNEAFLYLGVSPGAGKRIQISPEITQSADRVLDRYTYVGYHDSEIYNPVAMGRTWLGEKMGNETLTRSFQFAMPSSAADTAWVKLVLGGAMKEGSGSILSTINGQQYSTVFNPLNEEFEAFKLSQRQGKFSVAGGNLYVELELIRPNTQSSGWLDYIEYNVLRAISVSKTTILRNPAYALPGISETRIPGSGYQVWNVADQMNPTAMVLKSGSGYEYFRSESLVSAGAFAAFDPANCMSPVFSGTVAQQDVLSGDPAELIIISHPAFINEANSLADFRRSNDGFSVKVVQPQTIYNEYSASQQDVVAIRDYLKDEYTKAENASGKLKYVLLMGTTSYDPKNRIANNTNFIPVYQSPSYFKSQTFCLDDFYGYFDPTDGVVDSNSDSLWVAIGRLPVRTADEAKGVVEKLKRYASKDALGPWRTEIGFICDDVDDSWEAEFALESEKYAGVIEKVHPDLLLNKIYADAYKQQSTGNTEKYPDVSNALNRAMQNGSLFLNYQGHGGEKGWAQEAFLTVPMINSWSNRNFMPVLFTATCEFSRYDDPGLQSGGELALLNPNGGAIALMSTTRLVFVSGNSDINYNFWTKYGFPSPNEPIPAVGDLFRKLKNRPFLTTEDNKFALLGDPSMRLAFPEHHVILDSINGMSAYGFSDTIKAFSVVKMRGHIEKRTGGKFNGFNGTLWVKVFDKPVKRYTLDNDNHGAKIPFTDQNSFIYKGIVSVTDGAFDIVFSVPKDISYMVDSGKIAMYAHNGVTDANGAQQLLIGGSLDQITPDNEGPEVELFMNDTTFIDGGLVESDALFIARVFDESGINATGAGIGRDMMAILDKGTAGEQFIILNDYFNYNLNSYTRGTVQFPLTGLSEGNHHITFKVWDIHNNSSEAVISFNVIPAEVFEITDHLAMPNPFRDEVHFRFTHNLAGKNIKARMIICDQSGRVMADREQHLEGAQSTEDRLSWDGRGAQGQGSGPGFYIYKVELTAEDGRRAAFSGKIIKY